MYFSQINNIPALTFINIYTKQILNIYLLDKQPCCVSIDYIINLKTIKKENLRFILTDIRNSKK